ncbi:protein of unknown function [Bradyrhizobium vignae]|uniref:Uncharacterized protein n=1 Tax=Bradyrhizobium vignae TaxID=1549949 RepID=A0A2U3PWE2_9BRAD|nr:protein of unknown function [Bradyrhizobium vignae]
MAPPHESLRLARTYFKLRSPAELRNHSRPVLVQKRFVCHPALESRVIPTLKNKLNAYGEGRVLTSHPRSAARKARAKRPHSSIQVEPITRPSLRDGRTAYAALSREPNSFWPPSRSRNSPAAAPVDATVASASA